MTAEVRSIVYIASQNAEIAGSEIRQAQEFAADFGHAAIVPRKLDGRAHCHVAGLTGDSTHVNVGRRGLLWKPELIERGCIQSGSVAATVDKKSDADAFAQGV